MNRPFTAQRRRAAARASLGSREMLGRAARRNKNEPLRQRDQGRKVPPRWWLPYQRTARAKDVISACIAANGCCDRASGGCCAPDLFHKPQLRASGMVADTHVI
jgi:hypothetical protein